MATADFGMIGLGVMGQNLARNIARNGYEVCGCDTDPEKVAAFNELPQETAPLHATTDLKDLVAKLKSPRKIMLLVPAGAVVDSVIGSLTQLLDKGDIIIDGGNSNFVDTNRRCAELEPQGLLFIGSGVSGGEEGALYGPSLMPGGSPEAWEHVKDIFLKIAAKAKDGKPCCTWIGKEGAGHFVKTIHNGIEYADMQLIAEAYHLMRDILGMSVGEMQQVFETWNEGELSSFLIEISAKIFAEVDPETGKPMLDVILDAAGQKGTGKWTSQISLDLGVAAPTVASAVFARCISAIKDERVAAEGQLPGPDAVEGNLDGLVDDIRDALFASKICAYAQGIAIMQGMSEERDWALDIGSIASIWREGCIIRAQFLDRIHEAYSDDQPMNLMLAPYFTDALARTQKGWRRVVAEAAKRGIPATAFNSALAYYDSYRSGFLPANMIQAQRDFFGAHTYKRVDKPRDQAFHTEWGSHTAD